LNDDQSNSTNDYTNIGKGKNLIVVQLESFQNIMLNRKIGNEEVTPNLNKLAKESIVFNNYYYQTAIGRTADAEFLSNTSLMPLGSGAVYYLYPNNKYITTASELKKQGYYTAVLHANKPNFWGRSSMYKSMSFDKFESSDNYNVTPNNVIGLGLEDKAFFKQSVEKIKSYPKPFYSFLITLTSHYPFKDIKTDNIINIGQYENTLIGDYLKNVRYTDEAIGMFIQELKDAGLWDNSIVVFYGDHNAIPYDNKNELAQYLYGKDNMNEAQWLSNQKVVSMIHIPGLNKQVSVDKVSGQIDLQPTLANMYGFTNSYALGHDIFGPKNSLITFRNEDVITAGNIAYIKSLDKVINLETGQELNKESYLSSINGADQINKNSDLIIENDLLNRFK
jgi:lipoteichoic acid synthase